MKKIKKKNLKIIKSINNNGYYIIKDFFNKKRLDYIKSSLINILNYIYKDNETDLQKKYYTVKKLFPKLKSHFYDIAPRDINLLQLLHSPEVVDIAKDFFDSKVIFSGRPAIHVHDDSNDKLLEPHQETNQISRDNILLWSPLYDSNDQQGGMVIYKDSHKHGYFEHKLEHPKLGKKSWTNEYTHVDPKIVKRFKKIKLKVKAGSAVLMHSAVLHTGYPTKKKGFVRIVITERFNPLKNIPFLKNPDAPLKIPFTGIDYNKIVD
tara:strand:- start:2179 stop:2970 length:792 start_codon:yes stop_codon:yes gene_type:complete